MRVNEAGKPSGPARIGLLLACSLFAIPAAASVSVTVTNSDAAGKQVSRFDVAGNAIDAHDGALALFGDTYYLYGTSYACGYEYQVNSTFCGFKVYSSSDLVHFTDRGTVVPAGDCQYCFRPHVIFNASTHQYVMWSDGGGAYHVYTSPSPTGPFTRRADPTLGVGGAVDEALFLDDDGTAYLIHNTTQVAAGLTADMVVEKLSADYLTTTGENVRLGLGDVEAFAVFKRAGVYHALMSDPTCAYCSGGTGEMTSTNMLGPWSGGYFDPNGTNQHGGSEPRQRARQVNADNCGGQPLAVLPARQPDGSTVYYFVADRWNNRAPNESLANFFIGPINFDAKGVLQTIDCVNAFSATLAVGSASHYEVSPQQDQSSGSDGFHHYCDIAGNVQRQQTFTPSRSSDLSTISITTFQSGHPNEPLQIDILDQDGTVLRSDSIPAGTISWAPHVLTIQPHLGVIAERTYTLRLHSATTTGCYGFEYNDTDVYARGSESYSSNGGATFKPEPGRDLKFTVDVLGASERDAAAPEPADMAIADAAVGDGSTPPPFDAGHAGDAGASGGSAGRSGCGCRIGGRPLPVDGHAYFAFVVVSLLLMRGARVRAK
jgi:Glycosyl hydrolases family 43